MDLKQELYCVKKRQMDGPETKVLPCKKKGRRMGLKQEFYCVQTAKRMGLKQVFYCVNKKR